MHELKAKTIIDSRFEVIERLGAGGMGVVYKAQQVGFDRIVALKLMLPQLLTEPKSLARFEREAQALSALSHRNISLFYAYGIWQGRAPYIAMEFIDAPDLSELLIGEGGRLSWKRTLNIVRQIAEGVSCAHSASVIHRDLKPSNVCVLQDDGGDLVKVMDFGLAQIVDEQGIQIQRITATGITVGSPLYMSPEQMHAQSVTAASDVYSIGCIMYQCIFGRPPHNSDDMMGAFVSAQNAIQLPKPEQVKALPAAILQVLETALAKAPADRYQSADEMVDAIARIESSCEKTADAKVYWSAPVRSSAPVRRGLSSMQVFIGAVVVLLVCLVVTVGISQSICALIAERLAGSPDAQSMKAAVAAAEQLNALGAYNQAGSFYDAALSISQRCQGCSDLWQRTEIAMAEAAMFEKHGQRERQQAALGTAKKALLPALQSKRFLGAPIQARRKFAVDALMSLSQWEPPHPADASDVYTIASDLEQAGLPDEAKLAQGVALLAQRALGNPNNYMHSTMAVATYLIDGGASTPYAKDILKFASPALHTKHAGPVAQRLLPICANLYGQTPNADQLAELRRAVCAIAPTGAADDLEVLSLFHPILNESAAAAPLPEQIQFYRHAIKVQSMILNRDSGNYVFWSGCEADLAAIFLAQGRPDLAMDIYEQANRLVATQRPNSPKAIQLFVARNKVAMAGILMQQGKWKEAEQVCRQIQSMSAQWQDFLQAHYADSLLVQCVAHNSGVKSAVQVVERPGGTYLAWAVLNHFDALKASQTTVSMTNPNPLWRSEAISHLGVFAALDGDYQRACGFMKTALEVTRLEKANLNQRLAIRYANYARALAACGRDAEAEAAFLAAQKLSPNDIIGRYDEMCSDYDFAHMLLDRGDFSRASKYFGDAQEIAECAAVRTDGTYRSIRVARALADKDLAGARRELKYALRESHESHEWTECQALALKAEVELAEGKREAAKQSAAMAMKKMKVYLPIEPARVLSSDCFNVRRFCKMLGVG